MTALTGGRVIEEIHAQASTLRRTAEVLAARDGIAPLTLAMTPVFAGCGTSYHLALTAASVAAGLGGRRATAVPAGDAWLFPDTRLTPETNPGIVAISRSGTTTETVLLARLSRLRGLPVLAVSVDGHELAAAADEAITLGHAHEESVVMTQSFSNLLLALLTVAARWAGPSGDEFAAALPSVADAAAASLPGAEAVAASLAQEAHRQYVYLGGGSLHGVALEGMLKMKEMTQVTAEAYHTLEFRHGPISTIEPGALAVLMLSHAGAAEELAVARDVRALGGDVIVLAPEGVDTGGEDVLMLRGGIHDGHSALLAAPFLQFLALHRTLVARIDPDAPRHLNPVVRLAGH
ncbi:MAG: SIS domain-containing protein [Candidatus Dormibacteria bacterium]